MKLDILLYYFYIYFNIYGGLMKTIVSIAQKTAFACFLSVAISLFLSCSSGGGGGNNDNSGDNKNPDVNVPTKGKSVDALLQDAVNALKKEQWDEAVAYYNAAFDADNNDPRAIIYSTLANIAKISTDPKVVSLIKDNCGFTAYPNKLNALLSDSWMKEYPEDEYGYKSTLPIISTPDWLKNGGQGTIYNDALLNGRVFSAENWSLSLIANVIDKNSNGFNKLLDDVIDGVFGLSYNAAVTRLQKLENRKEDRIKLDPYFIEKLDLQEYFDENDKIGWAEVNAVLSAMLVVKASLEWVASYDLNTDLNWLKHSWKNSDEFLNQFKKVDAKNLPFNNNFLKVRPGKMAIAKASYVKAIRGLQDSYTSIQTSDLYPKEVKNAYTTINGGFDKLVDAINKNDKFYIPEDPTKGAWPTSKTSNVIAVIDLGRFFTEGFFSLQKIFETDGGKPVFYACEYEYSCTNDYYYCTDELVAQAKLTKANNSTFIDNGSELCLKFNLSYINELSAELDIAGSDTELVNTGLRGEAAKVVFGKYYP